MRLSNRTVMYFASILLLASCDEPSHSVQVSQAGVMQGPNNENDISAKEIADALGMHRVIIKIPDDSSGNSYGIAIKHKDGYLLSGYSLQKPGDNVKVLYWMEDKLLKYSIQGSGGSIMGYMDVSNEINFSMKSAPNPGIICKVGDIFEKWSVNEKMTSIGGGSEQLEEGEVGICFIKSDANVRSTKMHVVPQDGKGKF